MQALAPPDAGAHPSELLPKRRTNAAPASGGPVTPGIAAEIIALRWGGDGARLAERDGPIHHGAPR